MGTLTKPHILTDDDRKKGAETRKRLTTTSQIRQATELQELAYLVGTKLGKRIKGCKQAKELRAGAFALSRIIGGWVAAHERVAFEKGIPDPGRYQPIRVEKPAKAKRGGGAKAKQQVQGVSVPAAIALLPAPTTDTPPPAAEPAVRLSPIGAIPAPGVSASDPRLAVRGEVVLSGGPKARVPTEPGDEQPTRPAGKPAVQPDTQASVEPIPEPDALDSGPRPMPRLEPCPACAMTGKRRDGAGRVSACPTCAGKGWAAV